MIENDLRKTLQEQFNSRLMWTVTNLLDATFLILWIIAQWIVSYAIVWFPLSGLDEWIFRFFQFFFAISTLAPVAIFVYRDLRIMAIKAQQAISRESELRDK